MNSPDLEEQLEADVYSNFPSHNEDSTGVVTRRNRSTSRSKHSETEQRRRCKINERFQALMDIVPQNDQKRDKASFLLEVIEYIHFLQEKVQMHEGSHQMWYQPPTKLIPWRNNHQPVADHPQILKSFSSNDKVAASPDIDSAACTKILQHSPSSAVSSYVSTEPLVQFVQHEGWQQRQSRGSVSCNTNELFNLDHKTSATLSTVFSQRVLHTLTKALKSSGVNMSETLISVQLSLRERADCEHSVTAFASEDYCNSNADEEGASQTETRSFCKELDHSQKRTRR